jgi:hypothetical protein
MRVAAFLLAAVSISVAGCSSDDGQPTPAPPTQPGSVASPVTLQCVNGLDTSLRGLHVRPVLGVVALPVSPYAAALATGRVGGGPARLFAKSALVVKKGSSFSLRAKSPHDLGFSWNAHGDNPSPTRSLVVTGCRGSSATKWLAFVGGYYVNRASCVALIVETSTGQQGVNVGVGAPCRGQHPPVGPSRH